MKDASKLTTLVALIVLVVAVASLRDGLPNVNLMSDTVLWILGGLFIWRVIGGGCCGSKRGCRASEPPAA